MSPINHLILGNTEIITSNLTKELPFFLLLVIVSVMNLYQWNLGIFMEPKIMRLFINMLFITTIMNQQDLDGAKFTDFGNCVTTDLNNQKSSIFSA